MVRPRVIASPDCAEPPERAATWPILIGSAARAGAAARLAVTAIAANKKRTGRHTSATNHAFCMDHSCKRLATVTRGLTGRTGPLFLWFNFLYRCDPRVSRTRRRHSPAIAITRDFRTRTLLWRLFRTRRDAALCNLFARLRGREIGALQSVRQIGLACHRLQHDRAARERIDAVPVSRSRRTTTKTRSTSTGERPADGSSSINNLGRRTRPCATASICCCPPESATARS